MCMVHATRNTMRINTLNLRNKIIFVFWEGGWGVGGYLSAHWRGCERFTRGAPYGTDADVRRCYSMTTQRCLLEDLLRSSRTGRVRAHVKNSMMPRVSHSGPGPGVLPDRWTQRRMVRAGHFFTGSGSESAPHSSRCWIGFSVRRTDHYINR